MFYFWWIIIAFRMSASGQENVLTAILWEVLVFLLYSLLRREIWFSKKEFKNILLGFSVSSILRLLHSCSIVRSTIKSWLSFLFTHSFIFHIGWCYFLEHFLHIYLVPQCFFELKKMAANYIFYFFSLKIEIGWTSANISFNFCKSLGSW